MSVDVSIVNLVCNLFDVDQKQIPNSRRSHETIQSRVGKASIVPDSIVDKWNLKKLTMGEANKVVRPGESW